MKEKILNLFIRALPESIILRIQSGDKPEAEYQLELMGKVYIQTFLPWSSIDRAMKLVESITSKFDTSVFDGSPQSLLKIPSLLKEEDIQEFFSLVYKTNDKIDFEQFSPTHHLFQMIRDFFFCNKLNGFMPSISGLMNIFGNLKQVPNPVQKNTV